MPILLRPSVLIAITLAIFLTSVVALALPIIEQTHIHVEIGENKISDVWVETPLVSLISTLIHPARRIGINTINITISKTGESFQLKDVPSGEYTVVWVNRGIPELGHYTIKVKLIQDNIVMDTFELEVSF